MQSFTFQTTVLVMLTEAHFETTEWAARFVKKTTTEKILDKACNNSVFRARLKQSFSDSFS